MPFAFAFVGVVLLIAGVRGTSDQLLAQLKIDLTGDNNFVYWILAIGVLGALGYIDSIRPLSRALLLLVMVVLVLSEGKKTGGGGLFSKFTSAIGTITERTAA
jgi:hypothetical protein